MLGRDPIAVSALGVVATSVSATVALRRAAPQSIRVECVASTLDLTEKNVLPERL